ncbi:MAG: hypothetical protein BWY91_03300 [bacterium ADurb.BinA028]|nr:MAG: hypothetical protein BWY91_03300 [bacterium ADurb.BinA028]
MSPTTRLIDGPPALTVTESLLLATLVSGPQVLEMHGSAAASESTAPETLAVLVNAVVAVELARTSMV